MDDELVANGLDALTGRYLLPSVEAENLAGAALREAFVPFPPALPQLAGPAGPSTALTSAFDHSDLAQAGWGVIFADDASPSTREALLPLLDHRRAQATAAADRFRQFAGPDGHRTGETATRFLRRHGVDPGQPAEPDRVPYYLLLVGDPQRIPFRFQYLLDGSHAVGRLHFAADDDYATYAAAAVAADGDQARRRDRAATFFGTRNPDDLATRLSADLLVGPLAEQIRASFPDWDVRGIVGAEATKARLKGLLGRDETPGFLFTASQGVGLPGAHESQLAHQGALVGQDWPGPVKAGPGPLSEQFFLTAADIGEDADVGGLIAFFFACYAAGTPRTDDFLTDDEAAPLTIAPEAFVARLPQRLLSHPNGAALAVIGHVERAWPSSFRFHNQGSQIEAFTRCVTSLLAGHPVGVGMESFSDRYQRLNAAIVNERESVFTGKALADPATLASLYTARNDARNYALLGDPAVRLSVSPGSGRTGSVDL